MESQEVNLANSLSAIEDTDVVLETARLVQNQLLADTAAAALAITSERDANMVALIPSIAFR